MSQPTIGRQLLNTLIFALGGSILAAALGVGLAWISERTDTPLTGLFWLVAILPLAVPAILLAEAWQILLHPKIGMINAVLQAMAGLREGPFNIFSLGGMIWVESLHLAPFAYLLMVAPFRSMDPSFEEAAVMFGAGQWQTFWRITLQLDRPAVLRCSS